MHELNHRDSFFAHSAIGTLFAQYCSVRRDADRSKGCEMNEVCNRSVSQSIHATPEIILYSPIPRLLTKYSSHLTSVEAGSER